MRIFNSIEKGYICSVCSSFGPSFKLKVHSFELNSYENSNRYVKIFMNGFTVVEKKAGKLTKFRC